MKTPSGTICRALIPGLLLVGISACAHSPARDQDAVAADPDHHLVLFEDDNVRILKVVIEPGDAEKMHIHAWSSLVIYDRQQPAFTHRFADGTERLYPRSPANADYPLVLRLSPDSQLQGVENTDTIPRILYRIEFKNMAFASQIPSILMPPRPSD